LVLVGLVFLIKRQMGQMVIILFFQPLPHWVVVEAGLKISVEILMVGVAVVELGLPIQPGELVVKAVMVEQDLTLLILVVVVAVENRLMEEMVLLVLEVLVAQGKQIQFQVPLSRGLEVAGLDHKLGLVRVTVLVGLEVVGQVLILPHQIMGELILAVEVVE
jgi:hypothetical protein